MNNMQRVWNCIWTQTHQSPSNFVYVWHESKCNSDDDAMKAVNFRNIAQILSKFAFQLLWTNNEYHVSLFTALNTKSQ